MSRRRGSMAVFDLEPEEPAAGDPGAPLGEGAGPDIDDERPSRTERTLARLRRVPRRAWAITAGVVAAAVVATGAGVAAGTAFAERQRVERLAAAPGGVVGVEAALDEAWTVDTDSSVLAVLPDGGVVVRDGADVLAVDVATGDERWRRTLGSMVDCGPTPVDPAEWTMPVDQVVCLSGEADDRTVTVLAADGAVVGERSLGDVTDLMVAPAPDGMIVVVEPDGPVPEPRRFSSDEKAYRVLDEGRLDGPGATLRYEDALTGGVHASVAAPFDPEETDDCLTWMNERAEIDLAGGSLRSSPGVVELRRCGVRIIWAPPGDARGMDPELGTAADGWWQSAVRSVDGGIAVQRSGQRHLLAGLDDDPEGVLLSGLLLDPRSTDGTGGPRLVATTTGLVALEPDDLAGEPRWEWSWDPEDLAIVTDPMELAWSTQVLARTADVVLVQLFGGGLVGLDAETGQERWSVDEPVEGWVDELWPFGAVTDGHEVLLLLSGAEDSYTLARLDLDDGRVVAQESRDGVPGWYPGTVDGHLVVHTSDGTSTTVTDEGGHVVHEDPGAALHGSAAG
ncbi:hypothetical protein [Isoptericola hypogeus]